MNHAGNFDQGIQAAEGWRAYLHRLPEADAPEALWQRIAAARGQRQGVRRLRGFAIGGAGIAAVLALSTLLISRPGPVDFGAGSPAIAAHTASPPRVEVDLRSLDDSIALAYARDAAPEELDALWRTRERLLADASAAAPPLLARL